MFLIFLLITVLLMSYVSIAWTCLNTPFLSFNLTAKIAPALLTLFLLAAFIIPHQVYNNFSYALQVAGHILLGLLFLYFLTVMAAMALQLLFKLTGHPLKIPLGVFVMIIAFIISAKGAYNAFKQPAIVNITVNTDVPGTDGIKIVHLSDTHFGGTVTPSRVAKLTKQINELEPDFIFFTGDIFEYAGRYAPLFIENVKNMHAKLGKYGVPGNHEYYSGVNANMDMYRAAGIIPLQNKTAYVGKINIVGVNDIVTSGIKPHYFEQIIRNGTVFNSNYNILLSHTPLYLEEAANNKIGLMLSGHTHNGQIWPFKYLTALKFPYINGLYTKDKTNLYVSSGTFYWGPPFRLGTINELPVIILKEAQQ
ncbi:metallophosphoesterase [Candidatus Proelusimicrobium volucris]|uniref:metallophosphoesterase n=1 Tax=Candidatus Proelusimicrobium volucris TaxID=3416225 RepID=UPI003D0C649B